MCNILDTIKTVGNNGTKRYSQMQNITMIMGRKNKILRRFKVWEKDNFKTPTLTIKLPSHQKRKIQKKKKETT